MKNKKKKKCSFQDLKMVAGEDMSGLKSCDFTVYPGVGENSQKGTRGELAAMSQGCAHQSLGAQEEFRKFQEKLLMRREECF